MSIILIALAMLAFFALASTIAVYSYDASPIGHGVSRLSPCPFWRVARHSTISSRR
jgi:hypothetical protein